MDRRSLLDGDGSPRGEHTNVFDDEFEVADFDLLVSDGFRPSHAHDSSSSSSDPDRTPTPTITSAHAHLADEPLTPSTSQPVRTSIQKPRHNANPFASSEDDSADEATPSLSFEPDLSNPRHSVSSASSHLFARTASVRLGSGPSHPYGMYPQATLARSSSAATSSTGRAVPPQSSFNAQAGPQHPYALYPQGVEEELDDETPHNAVPVGFLGGQTYQRRMGPDGEEQDFIGEDGHAEQLPPYTRYPEDGPEKMPLMGMPEAPTALHSRAPVAGTDPTMALMHTNLSPQQRQLPSRPQSMTDQSLLLSSPISGGHAGDSSSHLLPDKEWDEKTWKEKTWKERMKTRFCGCVPFWVIILALAIFVFIGSVLGGVIGGFVFGSRHGQHKPDPNDTLYDAKIIPTPPNMSVPPTGTYSLALSTPQAVYPDCLTNPSQQAAWNCDLGGPPDIRMYVGTNASTVGNASAFGAAVMYGQNITSPETFYYGTQSSWLKTSWSEFKTVLDKESVKYGPAFYFQTTYDKLVVVPGNQLQAQASPGSQRLRRTLPLDREWFKRKQLVKPADKPWFCVWKNTMLEGFIYPQQPINPASTNSSWSSISSSLPTMTTTAEPTSTDTKGMPTLITKTTTYPWGTFTFTGNPATLSAWVKDHMGPQSAQKKAYEQHRDQYDDGDDHGPPSPMPLPVPGPMKRQESQPAMFPFIVKLEERRVSGNTDQPYCEQWQILEDGELGPLGELPPTVILDEDDPTLSEYQSGSAGDEPSKKHSCHCQWTSGQ